MSTSRILQPAEGERLFIIGDVLRVLADAASTGGQCAIFESISPPGNGPPLHRHGREDEFFFVIEGTAKFFVDGKESLVPPGGFVFAARGGTHTFANAGNTSLRMLVICTPPGIENPFRQVDQLHRQNQATPLTVTETLKRHDLEVLGPPLLAPR